MQIENLYVKYFWRQWRKNEEWLRFRNFFYSNKNSIEERTGDTKTLRAIHVLGYKLERIGLECDKMFTSCVFRGTFGVEKNAENFHFLVKILDSIKILLNILTVQPNLMCVGESFS